MVDRHPDLARAIARDGHEIANHTYSHPNLKRISTDEVMKELTLTRQAIQRHTGLDTVLFRPPGGEYNRQIVRATTQAGYRMVLWDVLTHDVEGATPAVIRRRVLARAEDGAIILMHSGIQGTVEALPELISKLKERGYHFVTVSALLGPAKLPADRPTAPPLQTASRAASPKT
jgi:peptidoglycan/xylan/chitin deacetylase (PgdA/CDA1 family)